MSRDHVLILAGSDEPVPGWVAGLDGSSTGTVEPTAAIDELRDALRTATCVLADAGVGDAMERIRRAHQADPTVQAVLVAPRAYQPGLSRTILFTPGIGEVWVRTPGEVDPKLVARAGEVTRIRRGYRQTRSRIAQDLSVFEPSRVQRAVISDAYLAALLEAVPDPVISLDEAGIVLSWNPSAERVLGYPRGEAVGRRLAELFITPSGAPALGDDDLRAPDPQRRETRFRRRSGEIGVSEMIVSAVEAGGQRVFAVVLHDVTAERQAQAEIELQATELEAQTEELQAQAAELELVNEELQARTVELEETASARDRFYAAMSHELRTPINAVLGFLDLLLTGVYGPLAEKQEHGLVRARRAARHLHELVDDVLDLARIEAGRMELHVEETHFPHVIEEVIETIHSVADRAGSELRVEGPARHRLRTDPRRLRQILLNLLSNAVRFGLGRPILVRWDIGEEGGVRIEVVDRGEGIEPQDLERIFDEFTQVGSNSDGGTGLGLPISLRLARLLGGSLEVSSEPGEGSTFRLVLPASMPDPAQ
jgi:PAS domain S-box-containing protein